MKFRLQILFPFLVCMIALTAVSCKSSSDREADKNAAKKSDTESESGASDFDFEQLLKLIQALKDQDFDGAMKMAEEQKILKSEDKADSNTDVKADPKSEEKIDTKADAKTETDKSSDKESTEKLKADANVKAESDHDEL